MADLRICSVDDCGNPVLCRGLCRSHYRRARVSKNAPCSVEGCGTRSDVKGLCNAHYLRLRMHGAPDARATKRASLIAEQRRFIENALAHRGDNCLVWPWGKYASGYSCIPGNGKSVYGHRFICEKVHGAAPSDEHVVAHSCNNRPCCNPKHLRWATEGENTEDKRLHGTMPIGDKHGNTKLSEEKLAQLRGLLGKFSHRKLAEKFGVSRTWVTMIANGKGRTA